MDDVGLSEEQAYKHLRKLAMDRGQRLGQVAERIVAGQGPAEPAPVIRSRALRCCGAPINAPTWASRCRHGAAGRAQTPPNAWHATCMRQLWKLRTTA
jgi:hypothetical protein